MPNLNVKNIPEHLHFRLKRRALKNHRSLNGEILAILEESLTDASREKEVRLALERVAQLRSRCRGELTLAETQSAIDENRP